LEKHFSISLSSSSDDEGWQIVLVPLPGPFEKVIASIVVEGDLFVESLVVVEVNLDKTVIEFVDLSSSPEVLSDAERAYFQ